MARHLHDLILGGDMELFVDDGGSAADKFEVMFRKMERLFKRVKEKGYHCQHQNQNSFRQKVCLQVH